MKEQKKERTETGGGEKWTTEKEAKIKAPKKNQ